MKSFSFKRITANYKSLLRLHVVVVVAVVVVVLLLYIHGKQLWSCRDGENV